MVMIAEPAARKQGLAHKSVLAIMSYAFSSFGTRKFVAKISDSNVASLNLFQAKLGFEVLRKVDAFEETHLVREVLSLEGLGEDLHVVPYELDDE